MCLGNYLSKKKRILASKFNVERRCKSNPNDITMKCLTGPPVTTLTVQAETGSSNTKSKMAAVLILM